jgi:polyferredoxin
MMNFPKSLTIDKTNGFSIGTTIILSLFIALIAWFFVFSMASPAYKIPAALFSAVILALFVLMARTGRISHWRRIYFVMLALVFFPSFIAFLVESRGSMFITGREYFLNETMFCPIAIPTNILPVLFNNTVISPVRLSGHFASLYPVLIIWLIAILTVGRGWCSWVCFYGGWTDGCSRLRKKPLLSIRDPNGKLRYLNFAVLAFAVLASFATFIAVYCVWLCPYKIITETPAVDSITGFIVLILAVLAFFGLAIILPIVTRKRFHCMSICPLGAFQSLVDKISPYKVRINPDACTACLRCFAACPTLSLSEEKIKEKKPAVLMTCTKCGECMAVCPNQAIRYEFSWVKSHAPGNAALKLTERIKGDGLFPRSLRYIVRMIHEALSAKALLMTSGVAMGTIVIGSFAVDTIARIIHLVVTGSFLFQ